MKRKGWEESRSTFNYEAVVFCSTFQSIWDKKLPN